MNVALDSRCAEPCPCCDLLVLSTGLSGTSHIPLRRTTNDPSQSVNQRSWCFIRGFILVGASLLCLYRLENIHLCNHSYQWNSSLARCHSIFTDTDSGNGTMDNDSSEFTHRSTVSSGLHVNICRLPQF